PALFHIQEVTQPQGHSTSGSHERYKSKERLEWEKEMDCVKKLREFILENNIATEEEVNAIEEKAKDYTRTCKQKAWDKFINPIKEQISKVGQLSQELIAAGGASAAGISGLVQDLSALREPIR